MGRISAGCGPALVAAVLLLAGCDKPPAPASAVPVAAAPVAKGPEITPLAPAEEKRLTDMAKARRAADGTPVSAVLEYAEQQRADKFKVALIDIDYAPDSTPTAVTVCYWIGAKRLESDQDCKSIGWSIAADKAGLKPRDTAATQALEAGKEAFVRAVDQMAAKNCGPADGKGAAPAC